MDINELKGALYQGIVTVEFTKVSGVKRVMLATLSPSILPPKNESLASNTPNDSVLVVWDTEQNGWRSIKIDSIITWESGIVAKAEPDRKEAKVIGDWKPAAPTPAAPTPPKA